MDHASRGSCCSFPDYSHSHRIRVCVVIGNAQWRVLRLYVERVVAAVDAAVAGSYTEVAIPFE